MLPRFAADYRALLWTLVLTPGFVALQFARPDLVPYLWWVSCYFALACGVIAHNHNHCPTFSDKRANNLFGNWISVWYGYPTFAWIPTHNLNHHKLVNRAGDATITWRYTNKHNVLVALTYFFVSSYFQSDPIKAFIAKAKDKNQSLYRRIIRQYLFWGGSHVALCSLAVGLHGWKLGLYVYGLTCLVPAFFALWTIMLFNYEQHVHTDPWSDHNHSRSFYGKVLNFMLFNNGLHAAHHEHPGTHWSKLPEQHAALAPKIDPQLLHYSMWFYFFRQYVLATFIPSLGTKQVGRPGFEPPDGKAVDLRSDDVDSAEAGTNAQMFGV
ncbi:MAG: Fatty acid desaturase family protein [Polyangiaceae bacterium]|nr:Fatty acid desaturase family protein [Polyangiaceae bacterium]